MNVEKHVEHAAGDECEAERCRRCHTFTEGLQLSRATQLSLLCHAVPCCAMLAPSAWNLQSRGVPWSPVECCGVLWHSAELEILGAEATHSGRIPILKLITEKGGNLNAKAR